MPGGAWQRCAGRQAQIRHPAAKAAGRVRKSQHRRSRTGEEPAHRHARKVISRRFWSVTLIAHPAADGALGVRPVPSPRWRPCLRSLDRAEVPLNALAPTSHAADDPALLPLIEALDQGREGFPRWLVAAAATRRQMAA